MLDLSTTNLSKKGNVCFRQDIVNIKKQTPPYRVKLGYVGVSFNFTTDVIMNGGPDGSRTRVRKPLDITFSGCILCFRIPLGRRP